MNIGKTPEDEPADLIGDFEEEEAGSGNEEEAGD